VLREWGTVNPPAESALPLARVFLADANRTAAEEWFAMAEHSAAVGNLMPGLASRVVAGRVAYWLAPGASEDELAAAVRWARECGLGTDDDLQYLREPEYIAYAQVLLAQAAGQPQALAQAQRLLARLRRAAEEGGQTGRLLSVLLLQARAAVLEADRDGAAAAVERTLHLAQEEGHVRVFVDAGAPIHELLLRAARSAASPFIRTVVQACHEGTGRVEGSRATPSLHATTTGGRELDSLTARELQVLRLMADGLSNGEIARELVVAMSTVKRHVNHVFDKLQVRTRTQAVAKARNLGLL
jgi:LuxR family maltose regulon positive regulatory protein